LAPPGFAIIGTGRCGTKYVSELLKASSINCGHEDWWGFKRRKLPGLAGDSSWVALPDIERKKWSGPVIHIIRHPLLVVRSMVAVDMFNPERKGKAAYNFIAKHQPDVVGLDVIDAAVEFWVKWNERCAVVADLTLPINHVDTSLSKISEIIGRKIDKKAVKKIAKDVNSKQHLQSNKIPSSIILEKLGDRGQQFGYW